jgi:hypothetical protein
MRLALEVAYARDRLLDPRAPVLTQSQYQIRDPKRPSLFQSYPAQGDDVDEDVGVYGWAVTTSQQAANGARRRESKDTRLIRRSDRLPFRKPSRCPKGAREAKEGRKADDGYQVGAPMKSHGRQLAKSDGDCILADVGDCLVFDRRLGARSGPGRYRPCCCRHLRNSL